MKIHKHRTLSFALHLAAFLIIALLPNRSALAQPESRSHRLLELPTKGTADIQRQVKLLQHLRSMFQPQNEDSQGDGLSAEQLQMLQGLMKNLGDDLPEKIPEDLLPLLQQLAPDVAQSVASDPSSRRQAAEMLQQFLKNRQLPSGGGRNGLPFPNRSGASDGSNRRPSDPNSTDAQSAQPHQTRPSSNNSDANAERQDDNVRPMSDLQKMAEQMRRWNQQRTQNNRPSGSAASDNRRQGPAPSDSVGQRTDQQSSARSNATASGRQNNDDTDQPLSPGSSRLQNLLKELRKQAEDARRSNRANGGANNAASAAGNQNAAADSKLAGNDQSDAGPPSTVAGLLKQLENVPLEELDRFNEAASSAKDKRSAHDDGSVKATEQKAAEIRQRQDEIRNQLKSQGFQKTLKQIVSSAKTEARKAGATNSDGINGPLMKIMTGVSQDIVKLAKDAKIKLHAPSEKPNSPNDAPSDSPSSDRGGRSRSRAGSDSKSPGIRKATSEFFKNLAGSAAKPSASETPRPSTAKRDSASRSAGSLALTIAVLCLLTAAGYFFLRSGGPLSGAAQNVAGGATVPTQLRSRADVITAFHHVARTTSEKTEDWWTHRQVVAEVAESDPNRSQHLSQLSTVYEHARYLPSDVELSDQQLQLAESAFRRCR